MPNLSEELTADEVDVNIALKDRKDDLKDFARIQGTKKLQEQFGKYITSLKEGAFEYKKIQFCYIH